MKVVKFLLTAVIFFVAGFFLGQSYQLPGSFSFNDSAANSNLNQESFIIDVALQFSETERTEFLDVEAMPNESVLDLLTRVSQDNNIELLTEDYDNLGVLVTKIGDKENGADNKYWQYYVNGQMPQVGAAGYLISNGDEIEWKFMEFTEDSL